MALQPNETFASLMDCSQSALPIGPSLQFVIFHFTQTVRPCGKDAKRYRSYKNM
jgi:hypothetical protein